MGNLGDIGETKGFKVLEDATKVEAEEELAPIEIIEPESDSSDDDSETEEAGEKESTEEKEEISEKEVESEDADKTEESSDTKETTEFLQEKDVTVDPPPNEWTAYHEGKGPEPVEFIDSSFLGRSMTIQNLLETSANFYDSNTAPELVQVEPTELMELEPKEVGEAEIIDDDDYDSHPDANHHGETYFVIATSFDVNTENSGLIWVVKQNEPETGGVLITGLANPLSVCFDVHNNFLYAVEHNADENVGKIYQYEINWDKEDTFELASPEYVVVYEGIPVTSCAVDPFGNLYFTSTDHSINALSFVDAWSGYTNRHVSIYNKQTNKIQDPRGIDVHGHDELWFVNAGGDENLDPGVVNYAETTLVGPNRYEIETAI